MSRFSGNLSAVTWLSMVQTLDIVPLWITHLSLCLCNSRAQRKHDGTVAQGAAKLIWSKLSITRYYTMTRDGLVSFRLLSFCLLSFRLLKINVCHFAYSTNQACMATSLYQGLKENEQGVNCTYMYQEKPLRSGFKEYLPVPVPRKTFDIRYILTLLH